MLKKVLVSACLGLVLVTGIDHQPAEAQVGVVAAAIETGKAVGKLPIRRSPPGPFTGKGRTIGTTVAGAVYKILRKKVVPSVFGSDLWVLVEQADGKNAGTSGWVFAGKAANGSPRNFR